MCDNEGRKAAGSGASGIAAGRLLTGKAISSQPETEN